MSLISTVIVFVAGLGAGLVAAGLGAAAGVGVGVGVGVVAWGVSAAGVGAGSDDGVGDAAGAQPAPRRESVMASERIFFIDLIYHILMNKIEISINNDWAHRF